MKGRFFKPYCKCEKKCKCGATWSYVVDIGTDPKTGKRKQKKKGGFKTKAAAQEHLTALLNDLHSGVYVEESDVTFEAFSKEWLSLYEGTGKVKAATVRIRKHEIARLMDYFAKLKLKDVTRKRYQDALNDLMFARGFSQNTVDGAHRTGRMIFKKAVEMEMLKKDPTEFCHVPRKQTTVEDLEGEVEIPKYLERKELRQFLHTAKEKGLDLDYLVFLTLAYTGVRAGELCALKWSDIDFEEQTIRITKTLYNPTNNIVKYELTTPKTKSAIRTITVDDKVLGELRIHQKKQKQVMMRRRKDYHNGNFIFASEDKYPGYPWYVKKIENRMARLLKLANEGIDDEKNKISEELTPHSLRHTHTSLLAQAGVSLPLVMKRLGHKDEETTKNVYLHVTKEVEKETSQKFKQLMQDL